MAAAKWIIEKRDSIKYDSFSRDNVNVPETGCLSIIVLGASGDLAKKKTFPALFNLYRQLNLGIFTVDNISEFSVLVDRATGVASIKDGEIELMLHRRIIFDDSRGVGRSS